jgi:hypothetical protein
LSSALTVERPLERGVVIIVVTIAITTTAEKIC